MATAQTVAALDVRDLTGPYGAPLIHDVSLALAAGAVELVVGPIQAGKTMLMRHIVGLERAEHGTISIAGESLDGSRRGEDRLRRVRTRVGVVFEGSALLTRITVIENVELPLIEHTGATASEARDAARELLSEVGLNVGEDTVPAQLGRAEQRRVALARALALRPPLLLLDEPAHGLDSHGSARLDETIATLQARHGFGLLIFSHEARYAFGAARKIYVMAGGRIVQTGDRDTLMSSEHPVVRQLLHRRGGR